MFRFSIRELMLVTLVAAIAAGWWVDRSRLARLATDRLIWRQRAEIGKELVEKWYGDEIKWGSNWPLPNYDPDELPRDEVLDSNSQKKPILMFPPETDYQYRSSFEE